MPCRSPASITSSARAALLQRYTVVLRLFLCFTCPAITVGTVILRALDGVRGRALGWLGPGSPKSQPHQSLRGVAKPTTTGWALTGGMW